MAVPAIHPGEHLADELEALSMRAAELARQLDVPTNRITEILNGQRAITGVDWGQELRSLRRSFYEPAPCDRIGHIHAHDPERPDMDRIFGPDGLRRDRLDLAGRLPPMVDGVQTPAVGCRRLLAQQTGQDLRLFLDLGEHRVGGFGH